MPPSPTISRFNVGDSVYLYYRGKPCPCGCYGHTVSKVTPMEIDVISYRKSGYNGNVEKIGQGFRRSGDRWISRRHDYEIR